MLRTIGIQLRTTDESARQRTKRIAVVFGIGALSLTIFGGCSGGHAVAEDPVFSELVDSAISEASANGADDAQLELLADARKSGNVSLEEIRNSVHAAVECFVDAGYDAHYSEATGADGLTTPAYTVSANGDMTAADDLIIDQCDKRHSFWVNKVYQLQPSSDQLRIAFINSVADELRACLEDAGYQTDPKATGVELAQQAGSVAAETKTKVDCLDKVGAT